MKIQPVILSGGIGSRLWPLSRANFPKQFQTLHGEKTMLQQTALRLANSDEFLAPIVVTNAEQRFVVAEQLREIDLTPKHIILEPFGRGSAPALAMAALCVTEPQNTVLLMMPADHFIDNNDKFREAVHLAAREALNGTLMTFGIRANCAHTGFGYIESGAPLGSNTKANHIVRFTEKPNKETAETYLKSGRHCWNSGLFAFRADVYWAALRKLQPAIANACVLAHAKIEKDLDFLRIPAKEFDTCPNLSIDYAVMEKTDNAGVLPVDFGWDDIGSWSSLWKVGAKDGEQNVLVGDVLASGVKNSYIRSEGRLIAAMGLENVILVETKDAILATTMQHAEKIKDIVEHLQRQNRPESIDHVRAWRPWGYYEQLNAGDCFQINLVSINPRGQLSLHYHQHRAEHWVIVSGGAKITYGDEVRFCTANDTAYVSSGMPHRIENTGETPLLLIEIQSGHLIDENDIVRLEENYNQKAKSTACALKNKRDAFLVALAALWQKLQKSST